MKMLVFFFLYNKYCKILEGGTMENNNEASGKSGIQKVLNVLKKFISSFRGKILLIIITFMILAMSGFLVANYSINYNLLINEKKSKLAGFSHLLEESFGELTYTEILEEKGALELSKEEKIAVLNSVFQPITDRIASAEKGLGTGYYCLELDAIISYGPYADFSSYIGKPISSDHQGRVVMSTNTPKVIKGTMVRGNILNAMYPILRGGSVIGYAWANETTTAIEQQFNTLTNGITIIFLVVFTLVLLLTIYVTNLLFKDINSIVGGVKQINVNLDSRITNVKGELGVVASSINLMAENIQKANDEKEAYLLSEASRKAQKDFLARMSHEIRTPMNGVLGMTRMALQTTDLDQKTTYLHKIQQSASLLLGIINDILDFSKIEAGKLELDLHPFNLQELVANIEELIKPKIEEKHLEFKTTIQDNIPTNIFGDSLRISQVLLNLLGNSSKFTQDGLITLAISLVKDVDDNVTLLFEVSDSGIGMSEEVLENLFKPFTQADTTTARKFGGTGLGLSISKALIEQMGGELKVRSKLNYGSTFYFEITVPKADETIIEAEDGKDYNELPELYLGLKALLVEDNEINQEIAVALLSEYNLVFDIANNGVEAVEKFKNNNYDLIFMDIQMPIMDGLTATREIRLLETNTGKRIPIIAMTANAMQDDRLATKEAGMDEHISKPFEIKELNSVLAKVIKIIKN
jgi:signal transduction histidine kinase